MCAEADATDFWASLQDPVYFLGCGRCGMWAARGCRGVNPMPHDRVCVNHHAGHAVGRKRDALVTEFGGLGMRTMTTGDTQHPAERSGQPKTRTGNLSAHVFTNLLAFPTGFVVAHEVINASALEN